MVKDTTEEVYESFEDLWKERLDDKSKASRRRKEDYIKKQRALRLCGYDHVPMYEKSAFVDDDYVPTGIVKRPSSSRRKKFYKRYSNKITRKSNSTFRGSQYRKVFDYWWEIY